MGKSIEKTDIFGRKYTAHYDDSGKKTGESWTKSDIFGKEYVRHEDAQGHKTGESRTKSDIFGVSYVEHKSSDASILGESRTKSDIFGREYVEHRDANWTPVGESRKKRDIFDRPYTEHQGRVPYQADRPSESRAGAGSSDESATSASSFSSSSAYAQDSTSTGTFRDSSGESWSGFLWLAAIGIAVAFVLSLGHPEENALVLSRTEQLIPGAKAASRGMIGAVVRAMDEGQRAQLENCLNQTATRNDASLWSAVALPSIDDGQIYFVRTTAGRPCTIVGAHNFAYWLVREKRSASGTSFSVQHQGVGDTVAVLSSTTNNSYDIKSTTCTASSCVSVLLRFDGTKYSPN